jgi:hypothetical protein
MKAFRILLVIAVLAVSMGMMPTTAKALAFASYESSINIQNLDNANSSISLIFYRQDGTIETTVSDTLPANGAKTYFPLPAGVGTGFNGSVVVTSTTNVASISNIRGNSGAATGAYLSQSSGATTVFLPVLMKNNGAALNNTWFNVQNAGTGDANITVTYTEGAPATFNGLKPGAAHTFNNNTETHAAKVFAGTVTSNQPVVVTVVQETTKMIYASNGFKSGATNAVIPLVNYQPAKGLQTGINLQNVGGSTTTVTLTYKSGATTCTEAQTIDSGKVGTFALYAFATGPNPAGITSDCPKGSAFVGSATVTGNSASMPLAAVVNQQKYTQAASAYGSFDPAAATSKFFAPLVQDRNGAASDLWSSINIMNVGTVATTVTCTFTGTSYTYTSPSIGPGEGAQNLHDGQIGLKYVGAATCIAANSSAKIIAIVNLQGKTATKDQMGTYEAINIAP